MRREVDEAKKEYESHKYQAMTKDREIEKTKIEAVKKQDEAMQRLQQMEQKMEMERQKHEQLVAQNQEAISQEKMSRIQIEKELKKKFEQELNDLNQIKLANQKLAQENQALKDNKVKVDSRLGDSFDLNNRSENAVEFAGSFAQRPATGLQKSPEARRRRFEERQRVIDALEQEDDLNETQKAMEAIQRKQRLLEISKERSKSGKREIGGIRP